MSVKRTGWWKYSWWWITWHNILVQDLTLTCPCLLKGCHGQNCNCSDDNTTCFPDSDHGDCRNDTCRDYYKLPVKDGFKFECVRECPYDMYGLESLYSLCVPCTDAIDKCNNCSKQSAAVVCHNCESGYDVVQNQCGQAAASPPGKTVCPRYTCVAPIVGGGVLVLLILNVWLVYRCRSRRKSSRRPPTRAELGVMEKVSTESTQLTPCNISAPSIIATLRR